MNGVEAAASLFGSEESDSDLFATLGADDTTSNQPLLANLFLSDEPSPHKFDDLSVGTQFYSQPETSTFGDCSAYTSPNHLSSGDNEHAQSYNGHAGHWNEQEPKNIDHVTYSNETSPSLNAPPAQASIQSYTPHPSLLQSTDNYLPPAIPATLKPVTSSYTPYSMPSNPPPATRTVQQPHAQVSSTQPYISQHTPPAAIPYGENTKPAITRPKYSNAYDPPFIPSSNRRTGRTGGAQQTYNLYQQTSSPYTPATGASHVSGSYHPQTTPYHADNSHALSEMPPNQSYPTYANALDLPSTNYSGDISVLSQREPSNLYPSECHNAPQEDPYHAQHTHHIPPSHGTVDSSSSLKISLPYQESVLTEGSSLVDSSVSASPPMIQYDAGTFAQTDKLNGSGESGSQHMPSYKREVTANAKDNYDPYAPKVYHAPTNYIPRTSSPLSGLNRNQHESKKPSNAPSNLSGQSSISSIGASPSVVPMHAPRSLNDEYPSRHVPQKLDLKAGLQDIKSSNTQYAPSPSLLGSNDPLERTSARAPVVTFGFGGKMVTCFHGMPGLNAGFDVALSSRTSSELKVHILHKLLPASALNSPSSSYPGPLLSDPGTPSLSLVRPSLSAQTKAKRAAIVGYLSGRANEIDQGLGYLVNLEKRAAQGTLILVKLLKIMVENDGRLMGTPQAELAVRTALVPRLEGSATATGNTVSTQVYKGIAFDEAPLTVTMLRPSALDRIQELLLLGDRRQAYQFAMDEKLWAHAMVVASSIDKDSWKEVVNDFLRTELVFKDDISISPSTTFSKDPAAAHKGNWESLRVAYSLFSGHGAASVQELAPPNSLLQRAMGGLQPPASSVGALSISPRTPNFSSLQAPAPIPPESLSKWAETVAMMISSPLPSETSVALTAFGDQLFANNWIQAAHACYLLSPQTSLMGGLGSSSTRITLLGSKSLGDAMKEPDALILTEILEFAMSLAPISKGQETFHSLAHLQAYRFIRAVSLAEAGYVQLATRYCEAISVSLNHTSPYTTNALVEQLQGLSQRLTGVHNDKAGSWIGGKISKPSLDTIGGWLEGRFTKLVTGDSDTTTPTGEETKSRDHPFAGPFAHYSTISSTTPSARSSPQPSFTNLNMPPPRTSSAMATSSEYPQVQIERSSSALGYVQQKPVTHTSTASFSSQSSPIDFAADSHSQLHDPYGPKYQETSTVDVAEMPDQAAWWGDGADNYNRTPTATTFMQIDESIIQPSADGFISLMDSHSFSVGPQQPKREVNGVLHQTEEDDDFGLSNSKSKPAEPEMDTKARESATPVPESKPAVPSQTETQAPTASGSWFGRWWGRGDATTSGPVKASLGEENAFYYDKEQKRWVNRKAGSEETSKPAPPPPSRAQTASPGMSGSRASPVSGPPIRSASAIDLGSEPPIKAPIRIRSNLAPPTESAPVTPTGLRLDSAGPPPSSVPPPAGSMPLPGRPKSQATKRNIRSRYVDVFQQETNVDT